MACSLTIKLTADNREDDGAKPFMPNKCVPMV